MAEFTKELFLKALDEWGRYSTAFDHLPAGDQSNFLGEQGYDSVRDLLTHVAAWWEEARGIIEDTVRNGDRGGRSYDLDAFNAAALKRFGTMSEPAFMTWYEAERQHMISLVGNLTPQQFKVKRVQSWLDAVLLEHLKEHGLDAPRFLVVDILGREWADYRGKFAARTAPDQADFLKTQGFPRFRDVLAHIVAWWEQGIGVVETASLMDPCDVEDVDAFNAQALERFGSLTEEQVGQAFDETRLTLSNLADMLPEEILKRPNLQGWLRADVLDHYYEHAL